MFRNVKEKDKIVTRCGEIYLSGTTIDYLDKIKKEEMEHNCYSISRI